MKLTDRQKSMLRIIGRSERDTDGWYRVSTMLWPTFERFLPQDIAEMKPSPDGGGYLKLTERGQAVLDYLS